MKPTSMQKPASGWKTISNAERLTHKPTPTTNAPQLRLWGVGVFTHEREYSNVTRPLVSGRKLVNREKRPAH